MNTFKKILVTVVTIAVVFLLGFFSGCMTVKGLASDIEVGAGAVNRAMEPLEKSREQARLNRAAQLVIEKKGNTANQ